MPLLRALLLALGLPICLAVSAVGQSAADDLIGRSIGYHDPDGAWATFAQTLVFEESRANGTVRHTRVTIDLPHERFLHTTDDGTARIARRLEGDSCLVTLNGSPTFSEDAADRHRLSCDRTRWMQDYYTYLWGLPMKLHDPGTLVDPTVERTTFGERIVDAVRVTYDPDVGGDVWYFYFDPDSARLVGYRFYHDESRNDGEFITLDGEYRIGSLRLPKTRAWYYNSDDAYLGTDTLVGHEPAAASY